MTGQSSNKEVSVELVDHIIFEALYELGFELGRVRIIVLPSPIRLMNLPVKTSHVMLAATLIVTQKPIVKLNRNLP